MIKEFALGISNRHHFMPVENTSRWQNIAQDVYCSLWEYDEYVLKYFKEHKTLANYDGLLYLPDEFILDIDGKTVKEARDLTMALILILNDLLVPYNIYFSGTGFHIGIPKSAFRWKPDVKLHLNIKRALDKYEIYKIADSSVIDKTRLIRILNTKNSKSGLWKIPITEQELTSDIENIYDLAQYPRKKFNYRELECEPVFDAIYTERKIIKKKESNFISDSVYYPCIQKMLVKDMTGSRHAAALRLVSHFRKRLPRNAVEAIMYTWQEEQHSEKYPFSKEEIDRIINSCYESNNGQGYNYGCADTLKDSLCQSTCVLYKSKKSNTIMDATSMEKVLVDFYKSKQTPLNFSKMFGQNFPIYPGEVVMFVAPPKSMKTMLIQNVLNFYKKNTYFLEMEMSPRQIWSRFVMIQKGWTEEQLQEHYSNFKEGLTKEFQWLTVDYSACFVHELDKRIRMLPIKPEIVVIDHIGLMRSRIPDNNIKVEEVSQGLVDLARTNNLIVFAISEITKEAFREKVTVASPKGSFRLSYNVNKLLQVVSYKDPNTNIIKKLLLKSIANREKESLNVLVNLEGIKII